jgi:hypothetical protein
MRKIVYVLLLLMAVLVSCKKDKDKNSGKPNNNNPTLYALDISEETDWNYLLVSKEEESSVWYNINRQTNVPTELFFKPFKDQDYGCCVKFQDNGYPDMIVMGDTTFVFGNFEGTKVDMAVIFPNSLVQYFTDIETGINWDNLDEQSLKLSNLKAINPETRIAFEHSARFIGAALGVISAGLAIVSVGVATPPLVIAAIALGATITGYNIINSYFGIGPDATGEGVLGSALGCVTPTGLASCLTGVASSAFGIFEKNMANTESKQQQLAEIKAEYLGGTGDIKITLTWNNKVDLDLHVIDPNSEEISFENEQSASGGKLDMDNTEGYGPENIFWENGKAIKGTYKVYVHFYDYGESSSNSSSYSVRVKYLGITQTFNGTVTYDKTVHVCSFADGKFFKSANENFVVKLQTKK